MDKTFWSSWLLESIIEDHTLAWPDAFFIKCSCKVSCLMIFSVLKIRETNFSVTYYVE